MNLHQIFCQAWTFLCRIYSDDSESHSCGQLHHNIHITTSSYNICDWQLHHNNAPAHVSHLRHSFFDETSNHPGYSAFLQPIFGALQLLAFPKTKITFDREEISEHRWHSGKYDGAADGDWENYVRSQDAGFEGDWGIIVLCTMFLVTCIFFNKCLYFSYYMAGYLLDRPHIPPKFVCWGPNHQYLRMWLYLKIRPLKRKFR